MSKKGASTRVYFFDQFPCSGEVLNELMNHFSSTMYSDGKSCVRLIERPSISRLSECEKENYKYVLPEVNLTGYGTPHVSIEVCGDNIDQLFWDTILVLRIVKPFSIGGSGYLDYEYIDRGNNDKLSSAFGRFGVFTTMNYKNALDCSDNRKNDGKSCDERYEFTDFQYVKTVLKKLQCVRSCDGSYPQILSMINGFAALANGLIQDFHTPYLLLPACMEYILDNPGKEHFEEYIAIICDLTGYSLEYSRNILKKYKDKRNLTAHNCLPFHSKRLKDREAEYIEIYNFYEMVRLIILRILYLSHDELLRLESIIEKFPKKSGEQTCDRSKTYNELKNFTQKMSTHTLKSYHVDHQVPVS